MTTPKPNIKFNWPLVGNNHIIDFLSRSIINEEIAQTYIFLGPSNLGKTTVANYFAKSLLCQNKGKEEFVLPCGNCSSCQQFRMVGQRGEEKEDGSQVVHGDFHLVKKEKDKKNISIEQVREFIKTLSLSSFLGFYKIGIIKGAEDLSQEAANALLKTLEEPKERVIIILITSRLESLPATIVSRSQILNFYPIRADVIYDYLVKEHGAPRSVAKNLSRLAAGRPALAVKFLEDKDFFENYIARVNVFLDFANQDINARLEKITELMGSGSSTQEAVKSAFRIIEIWQGLIRDLLLIDLGRVDLIQHEVVLEKLEKLKSRIRLNNLLEIIKSLQKGQEYLMANVSPKLVLENICINF